MTKTIYIASTGRYAGKTLTTLALGYLLDRKGISFSFFKPVGISPRFEGGQLIDDEAHFVAQALKGQSLPRTDGLCPVILSQDLIVRGLRGEVQGLLKRIVSGHGQLASRGRPILATGAGGLYSGGFLGISGIEVARALEAKVILVARYGNEDLVDELLRAREILGEELLGIVINGIKVEDRPNFEELILPFLHSQELRVIGSLPHDDLLAAVSVANLRDFLGARLICRPDQEGRLVEHFLIGGMQVDKAISYFRRTPNFGVIVGGDRSDILLAAIETGAHCLVLTGGLYPNEIIISRAEDHQVPILVLQDDTYTAARRIDQLQKQIRLRTPKR
ncbi:phosphotransacetylase family protein [Thermosulfuriphilus sp.]